MEPNSPVTFRDVLQLYVGSLKKQNDRAPAQQELLKFVNWFGVGRAISDVRPPEVGQYGEQMLGGAGRGQAADRVQEIKKFLSFAKRKGLIEESLAQHVRAPKTGTRARKDSVLHRRKTVELTAEGHKRLVEELARLKGERGPLAAQIRQAAADKDVRENVPLEAAREQLGHVESRIAEIDGTLNAAVVVNRTGGSGKPVAVGSKVSLKDLGTGRDVRYTLVSAYEADPLNRKISDVSPVGRALVDRVSGQEIEVDTPGGKLRYRILRVS